MQDIPTATVNVWLVFLQLKKATFQFKLMRNYSFTHSHRCMWRVHLCLNIRGLSCLQIKFFILSPYQEGMRWTVLSYSNVFFLTLFRTKCFEWNVSFLPKVSRLSCYSWSEVIYWDPYLLSQTCHSWILLQIKEVHSSSTLNQLQYLC